MEQELSKNHNRKKLKKIFISLCSDPPFGFECRIPTKQDLIGKLVAIFADSLDESLSLLNNFSDRVHGIVITKGNEMSHSSIGQGLWHFIITEDVTLNLYKTVSFFLDTLSHSQVKFDENKSLNIEFEQNRKPLEQTRQSNNKNTNLLWKRAADINHIFENSMIGIFRSNLAGKVIYANQAILQILGYASIDTINKVGLSKIYEHASNRDHFLKLIKQGPVKTFETRFIRADGKIIDVILNGHPILGNDGQLLYLEGNVIDITEHKQAENDRLKVEKHLIESETLYRTLFESAEDAIFLMKDGIFVEFNQKTLEMFSGKKSEIFNHSPIDLSPPIQPDGIKSIIKATEKISAALNGNPQFFEWQHRKVNGTLFDAEVSLNKVELPAGTYIQAIVRDITDRKQIEAALLDSERNYREIFNASSDAIFIHDFKTGSILDVNSAMLKTYGYNSREEVIRTDTGRFSSGIQPYTLNNAAEKIKKAVEEGPQSFEWHAKKKNGDLFWVEVNLQFSKIGEEKRVLASVRNIDERKRAEEELKKAQNYFSNIINSMPSVLIGVDRDCKVYQWNKEAENITGISSDDASGHPLDDIFPRLSGEMDKIKKAIKSQKDQIRTNSSYQKDGRTYYEEVTIYPLISREIEGAVIRIDDVTKKKKLEEQLNHSRKMDAIGQLAGGVAHDFNNMLAGIMGAADLLKHPKKGLDKKNLKLVDIIIQASRLAADLTSKLLIFGRKSNVVSTNIDLHRVIDDIVSILNRTIDKKILITVIKSAKTSIIIGDSSELESTFINLGINASHAMQNGGKLHIETKNIRINKTYCDLSAFEIKPGKYIEIEIRDTGLGIPLENLNKIFDPFYTTKKQGKGTGLGLAAVYGSVLDHHGEITVYSEIDMGTSFHILLPCSDKSVDSNKKDETMISGSGQILLVDDEDILRNTGKLILEEMGYQVLLAENGKNALEIYRKLHGDIDLIIMDMIMPEMDGRDAFFKMKEINKNCKVIISSGFSKSEDLDELKKAGLDGFIRKPFKDTELSQLIAEVLKSR